MPCGSPRALTLASYVVAMPGPLLAIDGPFVMYRSFFALPDSITDGDGHPVNALLGAVNLILRIAADAGPRAIVVCWGAEAAVYRKQLYPDYHAARPPVPGRAAVAVRPRRRAVRRVRLGLDGFRRARGRRSARVAGAGRVGRRRAGAADDRRSRHVSVRVRVGLGRLPQAGVERLSGGRSGGGRQPLRDRPASWCPTSSRCAAIRPTACPAPPGSAPRRPLICCVATARSTRRSRRPMQSVRASPPHCASTPTNCARSATSRRCEQADRPPRRSGDRPRRRGRGGARLRHAQAGRAPRGGDVTGRPLKRRRATVEACPREAVALDDGGTGGSGSPAGCQQPDP